jgi:hypothetical protein
MERGMMALTRLGDVAEAWRRFFERGDIVGIKVNPVGRRPLPGEGGRVAGAAPSISSPEVVLETVRALHEYCAIPKRNLIVFERYADEFRDAGYERMMQTRELEECRWYASSFRYDNAQLRIDGQDPRQLRDPHVVGYDPDVFVSMGFAAPEHDARDDRRHRSHLSMIVTRMVNKLITIPCLKDHKSAGVTLALKNMSHGLCNNVARSHVSGIYRRSGALSGPNQCNTFIPTAVNQQPLREKAVLHILDGLVGVYEGGPGSWNRTWGTWPHRAIFFATDPVALDHVGWDLIDAKRAELGWVPVGHMGLVQGAAGLRLPAERVVQLATSPPPAAAAILAEHQARVGRISEPFDRRQPEHIALAGLLGLGTFGGERFEHRRLREA